jgi:hypothetical protein
MNVTPDARSITAALRFVAELAAVAAECGAAASTRSDELAAWRRRREGVTAVGSRTGGPGAKAL